MTRIDHIRELRLVLEPIANNNEETDKDGLVKLARFVLKGLEEVTKEKVKLKSQVTDRNYMMQAYREMLGPKGLEVAEMWDAKGVIRLHTSWGPEAHNLTGEERAQCLLDMEIELKNKD